MTDMCTPTPSNIESEVAFRIRWISYFFKMCFNIDGIYPYFYLDDVILDLFIVSSYQQNLMLICAHQYFNLIDRLQKPSIEKLPFLYPSDITMIF